MFSKPRFSIPPLLNFSFFFFSFSFFSFFFFVCLFFKESGLDDFVSVFKALPVDQVFLFVHRKAHPTPTHPRHFYSKRTRHSPLFNINNQVVVVPLNFRGVSGLRFSQCILSWVAGVLQSFLVHIFN